MARYRTIQDPPFMAALFGSTRSSVFWLIVRLYVGWQWFVAGWDKVTGTGWIDEKAGGALGGFIRGALAKTVGAHPDVQGWYASFLQEVVLPHAAIWSHVVAWGELAVGLGLLLGMFTGIAAFFGAFMSFNFLLAGAVSVNPILFVFEIGLILAWKVAGYIGVDRWLLPRLGTPWRS